MQVAKSIYIMFFIFTQFCIGQDIGGTYVEFKNTDFNSAISTKYSFGNNGSFERVVSNVLIPDRTVLGTYHIKGDTLLLDYEKSLNYYKSSLIIKEKESIGAAKENIKQLYTTIRVLDSDGKLNSPAILVIKDRNQNTLMAFTNDAEGYFPALNLYGDTFSYIKISSVGKQDIKFRTDSLFGFRTKIDVYLDKTGNSFNLKQESEKYILSKISPFKLELHHIQKNQNVLLEKIK